MLAGFLLLALFTFLNWKTSRFCGKLGQSLSFFKFVPILLVIVLGITFGILNAQYGLWNHNAYKEIEPSSGNYDFVKSLEPINLIGIIMSIPGILFAFEGYLVIGSISGEIDNAEKKVPLAMVIAILLISCVNIGITVGCITCGTGNVFKLMEVVFRNVVDEKWNQIANTVFSCFIFICIIGVVNGMTFGGIRALQAACDENLLFKASQIKKFKPNDSLFGGFVYYVSLMLILILGVGVPSICLNTDQIIDGLSEANVTAFYLIYGSVVLGGFINRFTKKVTTTKIKGFPIFALLGAIGSIAIFAFISFGLNGYFAFFDVKNEDSQWGLFQKNTFVLKNWQAGIAFWSFIVYIISLPFINDLLIRCSNEYKKNKNKVEKLIWQRA